jgi:tetratricopeptide (TPR) repeat protein
MKWTALILLPMLVATAAFADVIRTRDGRIVKGRILGESDGKITVKTLAGEVVVNRSDVEEIHDETSLMKLFGLQVKLLSDTDAEGFFRLGKWCGEVGLFDKEKEVYEWVIAIDFDHEGARSALGYVRDRSGAWVKMARESDGGSTDFKKALRYFKSGADEKAKKILVPIIAAQPGFLEARYILAEILITEGKLEKAEEAFREMLKIDKNSTWAYYGLGYIRHLAKKHMDALPYLATAEKAAEKIESRLQRKSLLAEIYYLTGACNAALGERNASDAEAAFLKAVALNPKHFRAWTDLGIIYGQKGITKKAQSAFDKAIRSNSKYVKARYNIAILLYRQGEIEKAMVKLYPLTTGSKPHVPALLVYGRCYQRAGKNSAAKKYYQKYLDAGGDDPRAREWLQEVQ